MKRAETWIYGVLLILTLGWAWQIQHAEEPTEKGEATVFDPGPGGITTMRWDGDREVATIEVKGKGESLTTWVTAGKRAKIETPRPGDDDDSAGGDDDDSAAETSQPAPEVDVTWGEPELRAFPGNATAKTLVESFSPLRALREFDKLEASALEQMGLDEPTGSLEIDAGGKTVRFELGDKAYGSSDTYVRDGSNGRVYLVASKDLSPLRGAENRLVERNLYPFEEAALAEVQLTVRGTPAGSRRTHQGRHDKANSFWSLPDSPDEQDTVFDGFLEKVLQLRASSYPTQSEAHADEAVEEVFGVTFVGDSGPAGTLVLGRVVDAARTTDEETVWAWVAKTELTRQWVSVSKATATDLADQLAQVTQ